MKKLSLTIVLAVAALMMTNCRKNNVQPLGGSEPTGETIDVALDAGTGDDKTTIDGYSISWVVGDKIHVVGTLDGYLGYMTAQSSGNPVKFKGTIKKTTAAQNYYFYYVGDNDFTLSGDNVYTFSVASQHGSLSGNANSITNKLQLMKGSMYVSGTPGAELGAVTLNCMMSIIRLNLKTNGTSMTSGTVTVSGGYSSVKINTKTGEYVSSSPLTSGNITLNNASGSYYMAVITGNQTSSGTSQTLTFASSDCRTSFTATIAANKFYNKDSAKVVNMEPVELPGEFTVNTSGTKVHFSKGNLQYIGSTTAAPSGVTLPYWRFATNQWDYMGDGPSGINPGNVTVTGASSYNYGSGNVTPTSDDISSVRDLFGWGTSGWDNGNYFYQPYCTSNSTTSPYTSSNGYGYGPTNGSSYTFDLTGDYAHADWGVHNTIYVGGTATTGWRTLSGGEWEWLLGPYTSPNPGTNCRSTTSSVGTVTSNARYSKVKIEYATGKKINGLLIYPDSGFTWNTTTMGTAPESTNVNATGVDFPDIYTVAQFQEMEASGVVFLPAAGDRVGASLYHVGSDGYYWSSTRRNSSLACYLDFYSSHVYPQDYDDRYNGGSVRLVR